MKTIMGWTAVHYPLGGFETGWHARQASHEKTPYEIDTSSGAIRRQDNLYGSITPKTNAQGDKEVGLRVPKRKYILVHNLVCWVAHGPRPHGKTSVDHYQDRDRANNNAVNLRWASPREQAHNRKGNCGRKCLLSFTPQEGEKVYDFMGRPGLKYTGPRLQFTSHNRIIRQGRVSQIQRIPGQYPKLGIVGLGEGGKIKSIKVHILAWSAFHGPEAEVPSTIHHRDHDPTNFRPENLEASNPVHNSRAAHNAGRFDHTRSKRQRVLAVDAESGAVIGEYESQMEAARILRANQGHISHSIQSRKSVQGIVDGVQRRLIMSRASM